MSAELSLSFVLLPHQRMPSQEDFQRAWHELTQGAAPPTATAWDAEFVSLEGDGVSTVVGLMPAPVPKNEAENAASCSVLSLSNGGYRPAPHVAHLTVASRSSSQTLAGRLLRHTRLVAALAKASGAIAVYEGSARATHPAEFYFEVAGGDGLPAMLWTGLSVVRTESAVEFLTLSLERLQLPDILLSSPKGGANEALLFLFQLVQYVVERGSKVAASETVGRSATEKYVVAYVPSPHDPAKRVMRVDMARKG